MNFIIPLVVYPFDVMISIAETDGELQKAIKKHTNLNKVEVEELFNVPSTCKGRTISLPGGQTILRLFEQPNNPFQYGILAHEIFHVCEFIMRRIGITLHESSDEAYAYLIGYLTEKIHERL